MINCIIIDDERQAREALEKLINRYFNDKLHVIETADSVKSGVEAINKFKPDLIFLDVEMPVENGFKLFTYFDTCSFDIIFTTAYSQYAIDAIKYSAIDYLLKPVNHIELRDALKRLERKLVVSNNQTRIEVLLQNLNTDGTRFNKIAFPVQDGFKLSRINNIIYCEADVNYTKVFFTKNESITIVRTLKNVEELLPSEIFFRTHKSYLVNLNYISSFERSENMIVLDNGNKLPVSYRKVSDLVALLSKTRSTSSMTE